MTISPCSYNDIQTHIHMQVSRLLFLKNGVIYIGVYISVFLLVNILWKSLQAHCYSSYPLSLFDVCIIFHGIVVYVPKFILSFPIDGHQFVKKKFAAEDNMEINILAGISLCIGPLYPHSLSGEEGLLSRRACIFKIL